MTTINIELLEQNLGIKIKRNVKAIGLDTATKTGYAVIETDDTEAKIDVGFINAESKVTTTKYNMFVEMFDKLIQPDQIVIIEDTFLKYFFIGKKKLANVNGLKTLTRIGMIAYTIAIQKKCKQPVFINACSARSKLNMNGKAKKEELVRIINTALRIQLTNNDEVDALILAINGVKVK
jgi:Holliday junction resolvasome RuvABC endonuclease subunit